MSSPGRQILLDHVLEDEWQAQVIRWAQRAGWKTYHTFDSRRSTAGFPDCVFVRPLTGEIVYAELKAEHGKVSSAQQWWIDALAACNQRVFVWRPSQEGMVKSVLGWREAVA